VGQIKHARQINILDAPPAARSRNFSRLCWVQTLKFGGGKRSIWVSNLNIHPRTPENNFPFAEQNRSLDLKVLTIMVGLVLKLKVCRRWH
jgi:hypothetical protein